MDQRHPWQQQGCNQCRRYKDVVIRLLIWREAVSLWPIFLALDLQVRTCLHARQCLETLQNGNQAQLNAFDAQRLRDTSGWLGCRMVEGHYLHASVCGFVSITLHKIQQVAWLGNAVLWLAEHLYTECRFGRWAFTKRQFKWNSMVLPTFSANFTEGCTESFRSIYMEKANVRWWSYRPSCVTCDDSCRCFGARMVEFRSYRPTTTKSRKQNQLRMGKNFAAASFARCIFWPSCKTYNSNYVIQSI